MKFKILNCFKSRKDVGPPECVSRYNDSKGQ